MHFIDVKGILSAQNGMNIYRGCTHGCIYCDSRSKCYGFTHDFEDIEVKQNACELLEKALKSKRKKCMIGTGSMSDPYMHCEQTLKMTRKCLEIIDHYGFGAAILTKSSSILRDLDLLVSINKKARCVVQMTMTTYSEELCRILEPRVSTTKERFETLKILGEQGIDTIVWLSPILPFINDTKENIEGIIQYCIQAKVKGILCFGMGVTMREGNREYFYAKLDEHFPGMKNQYRRAFGDIYVLNSPRHQQLMDYLKRRCEEERILFGVDICFDFIKKFPVQVEQMSLF